MTTRIYDFDSINEDYIQKLVTNGIGEGYELEFKRTYPSQSEQDKSEFLKDVTAFANSFGGDLIYGIMDIEGTASSCLPITDISHDSLKQRLESIIRSGVEPKIIGLQMKEVSCVAGGYLLFIRIPKSWHGPHRVIRTGKFHARNSSGVYEMGVEQLRAAFLGSDILEKKIADFRGSRNARIIDGGTVSGMGQCVLHIVPLSFGSSVIDIRKVHQSGFDFAPISGGYQEGLFNFDGYIVSGSAAKIDQRRRGYTQIFRNGSIEAVQGSMVRVDSRGGPSELILEHYKIARDVIFSIRRYIEALSRLEIGGPYAIMLSLLNIYKTKMILNNEWSYNGTALDRDNLIFDPILYETSALGDGWEDSLKPIYDAWWNAYGYEYCHTLWDEAGRWKNFANY